MMRALDYNLYIYTCIRNAYDREIEGKEEDSMYMRAWFAHSIAFFQYEKTTNETKPQRQQQQQRKKRKKQ